MGDVAKAVGLGGPTNLSSGGSFKMTSGARKGEEELLKRLRDQAAGKSPSITGMQFQQSMEDIAKQQQSAAASARGVSNTGLLARQALIGGQQASVDLANEAAIAKLQEQRSADQLMANIAAGQRGVALQSAQTNQQADQLSQARRSDFLGRLAGAAGTAVASDVSLKENINQSEKSGTEMVKEFLNALESYTYNYKDSENNGKKNPEGKVTSVMAQDLEKSKLGKQMVQDGPEGKMVDYGQGMAPLFAAIAELDKRTKKIEKKA